MFQVFCFHEAKSYSYFLFLADWQVFLEMETILWVLKKMEFQSLSLHGLEWKLFWGSDCEGWMVQVSSEVLTVAWSNGFMNQIWDTGDIHIPFMLVQAIPPYTIFQHFPVDTYSQSVGSLIHLDGWYFLGTLERFRAVIHGCFRK